MNKICLNKTSGYLVVYRFPEQLHPFMVTRLCCGVGGDSYNSTTIRDDRIPGVLVALKNQIFLQRHSIYILEKRYLNSI
jgi:hypothetical protein